MTSLTSTLSTAGRLKPPINSACGGRRRRDRTTAERVAFCCSIPALHSAVRYFRARRCRMCRDSQRASRPRRANGRVIGRGLTSPSVHRQQRPLSVLLPRRAEVIAAGVGRAGGSRCALRTEAGGPCASCCVAGARGSTHASRLSSTRERFVLRLSGQARPGAGAAPIGSRSW